MMERNGHMFSKSSNSGHWSTTLCRYGQYLQTTSEQKNWTVCEASCFWRYNGYANISPRNIFSPFSKTPWRQTATSTPSSSSLLADLLADSRAAVHWPAPHLPFPGFLNRWGQIQTFTQLHFFKISCKSWYYGIWCKPNNVYILGEKTGKHS